MNKIKLNAVQSSPIEAAMMSQVFESGEFEDGEFLSIFQKQLAEVHAKNYCITKHSGIQAIECALKASRNIHKDANRKVVISALASQSVYLAAKSAGWDVVIADVEPELEGRMLLPGMKDVGAVVLSSLFGIPDSRIIPYNIPVIHDARSCMYSPTLKGDAICVDFSSSSLINAGMGGAILTDLPAMNSYAAYNYRDSRFPNLNAAIALGQHLNRENLLASRRLVAEQLKERIDNLGWIQTLPMEDNVWTSFPMLMHETKLKQVVLALHENNIQVRGLSPLHRRCGNEVELPEEGCPNAEALTESIVIVGCHPLMDDLDIDRICSILESF